MATVKDPRTGEEVILHGHLHKAYIDRAAAIKALCQHPVTDLRQRGRAVVEQCMRCGVQKGSAIPREPAHDSLPSFDGSIAVRHEELQKASLASLVAELIASQRAGDEKVAASSHAVALDYAAYLRTPEWQQRRQKVLKRAGGICEGCLSAPATEVHHKTYRFVGDEPLYDLVAVCRACHMKEHPEHHEHAALYEDYSPCSSCRWSSGGVWCGKFEIETFKAFEAGGKCFPPGSAAEELH